MTPGSPTTRGPLDGVRVLDLTSVVMGPYATATLGDLGADVIKVEPPAGDMSRRIGAHRSPGMSGITLNLQRNKRSIVLDLTEQPDLDILTELVRTADVLVTNLRPRSRDKLGLTWELLSKVNPGLVMCVSQAYASNSPRADAPAYDDVVQAASGVASLATLVDGAPKYAPFVVADKVAGLYIVSAVLAALVHKARTDEGQYVEVPMVDSLLAFNLVEHLNGMTFSPPEGKFGWSRVLVAGRVPHRTSDGWVCIMPYTNRDWDRFFDLVGVSDMASDPRFATVDGRHTHMGELLAMIGRYTPSRSTAEWLQACEQIGVPASEVMDLADAVTDPYVLSRELLREVEHPTEGTYFVSRTPFTMSRTPSTLRRHAPRLGEHTDEIIGELFGGQGETAPGSDRRRGRTDA